jgi:hypothetical protein
MPDDIATCRDDRLEEGRSGSTVGLELALLGHLYTTAIKEWGLGLVHNSVSNIRRPSAGQGRNRRLPWSETKRMLKACDAHSTPMQSWSSGSLSIRLCSRGEILSLTLDQVGGKGVV